MRSLIVVLLLIVSLLVSDFVKAKQLLDSKKMNPISHIKDIFVGPNKQLVVSMGGTQSSGAIVCSDNGGRKWQVAYNDPSRPARNLFAQGGGLLLRTTTGSSLLIMVGLGLRLIAEFSDIWIFILDIQE